MVNNPNNPKYHQPQPPHQYNSSASDSEDENEAPEMITHEHSKLAITETIRKQKDAISKIRQVEKQKRKQLNDRLVQQKQQKKIKKTQAKIEEDAAHGTTLLENELPLDILEQFENSLVERDSNNHRLEKEQKKQIVQRPVNKDEFSRLKLPSNFILLDNLDSVTSTLVSHKLKAQKKWMNNKKKISSSVGVSKRLRRTVPNRFNSSGRRFI